MAPTVSTRTRKAKVVILIFQPTHFNRRNCVYVKTIDTGQHIYSIFRCQTHRVPDCQLIAGELYETYKWMDMFYGLFLNYRLWLCVMFSLRICTQ